jgi:hypothetical protein
LLDRLDLVAVGGDDDVERRKPRSRAVVLGVLYRTVSKPTNLRPHPPSEKGKEGLSSASNSHQRSIVFQPKAELHRSVGVVEANTAGILISVNFHKASS